MLYSPVALGTVELPSLGHCCGSRRMKREMAAVNLSFSFRTPSIVNPSKRRKRAPMES